MASPRPSRRPWIAYSSAGTSACVASSDRSRHTTRRTSTRASGRGQPANGNRMPAGMRTASVRRPACRDPSILRALSLTTTRGERRRRARTRRARPRGACPGRRQSHEPRVRELPASHPPPCGASTRARAGLARDARLASLPLRERAHSRFRAHSDIRPTTSDSPRARRA
jgi:hypothetical protein